MSLRDFKLWKVVSSSTETVGLYGDNLLSSITEWVRRTRFTGLHSTAPRTVSGIYYFNLPFVKDPSEASRPRVVLSPLLETYVLWTGLLGRRFDRRSLRNKVNTVHKRYSDTQIISLSFPLLSTQCQCHLILETYTDQLSRLSRLRWTYKSLTHRKLSLKV